MKIARPADPRIEIAHPYAIRQPLVADGPKPVVLLLHPPRTGGATVHFNLEAMQSAQDRPYVRLRIDRNKYSPPTLIVPGWTGAWNSPDIAREKLAPLMERPADEPLFISGHFPYGIHERLKEFFPDRPFVYIGQVRHPAEREISSMRYQAAKFSGGVSMRAYQELFAMGQLMDNPQTRMFAGLDAMNAPVCDDNMLKQAQANITAVFNMIATTDQTHTLMKVIVTAYGTYPVAYHRSNISKPMAPGNEGLIRIELPGLNEFHARDMELHDFVRRHWDKLIYDKTDIMPKPASKHDEPAIYVPADYDATRMAMISTNGVVARAQSEQDPALRRITGRQIQQKQLVMQ